MSDIYRAKNFTHLLGLPGLSDTLLTNHFTLYEGYVKNTNALINLLASKEIGTPEYAELKRRFGWEWNGMRLHELYFENLSKEETEITSDALKQSIEVMYGSIEEWKKVFTGIASMRGIGWVVLYEDPLSKALFSTWINEHDLGHLASCKPLLVMDVFEHAYMTDYGIKKADYIEIFFRVLDWKKVEERFGN
ncbi:MAG: superoxide dismutase [Candidatus Moranbacteria bacterium]|nr:superoxide dismutase [Candidatus Moranbacteria bacterium]OIQ03620.1 MAG: superoxide dismutase [Candidatus Moranbacteria bacterium CG2_30_41_165]PIP25431.1 MAG: superoxide dismutase [Candidatus Moranbacteria bacterium CG23_combo_of_CG06-09_8_20_14_all_41_28]PIV86402.1 MAG: superoxide dismutase [Candidatus Moranbacteria bacterium CG17_big_fil_post_rev_8_21_14_2_50_41_107]PIW94451.1 MAG: superoxide dismutase [Candidatus Moranbacteria bacterium CG_4_8_14_3_um_filter_41_13]PIX91836.1 MAG: supero